MTDETSRAVREEPSDDTARRTVPRRGSLAAVDTGVVVGTFNTPAPSSCPRTVGHWRSESWPPEGVAKVNDSIDGLTLSSVADGKAFLGMPPRGDKALTLARQLVATILNFQVVGGPEGDRFDLDAGVLDVTDDGNPESVRETRRLAEDWLDASDFPDPVRNWTVPAAAVSDGERLRDALDTFNDGNLVSCSCATE